MIFRWMRTHSALVKLSTAKGFTISNFHISSVKYFFEVARVMAYIAAIIADCYFLLELDFQIFFYVFTLLHCLPNLSDLRLIDGSFKCLFYIYYVSNNLINKCFHLLSFFYFMLLLINNLSKCLLFAIQIQ